MWHSSFGLLNWSLGLDTLLVSQTIGPDRAVVAVRLARLADQRAQFHQGLIVIGGPTRWQVFGRQSPNPLFTNALINRLGDIKDARQHALDIAIHHRLV